MNPEIRQKQPERDFQAERNLADKQHDILKAVAHIMKPDQQLKAIEKRMESLDISREDLVEPLKSLVEKLEQQRDNQEMN